MAKRNSYLSPELLSMLTVPGNGVFTIHTGLQEKSELWRKLYSTNELNAAEKKWYEQLSKLNNPNSPFLLGVPSDNGGGIQRGANWGPLAVRKELIKGTSDFIDLGDIKVIPHLLHDKYLNSKTIKSCRVALYGKERPLPVSPLSITEYVLKLIYKNFPQSRLLALGGDHSVSYPLVTSWIKSRSSINKIGIIHFDAHTDLLEQRLGIDLCFGTWTRHVLKYLPSSSHLVQLGIRSSGKTKQFWKNSTGIEQYWAHEINKWGVEKTFSKLKKYLKQRGIEELYITFDIDALDAKYASTTGTPEPNGLIPSDCAALISLLKNEFKITAADLTEVAPHIHRSQDASFLQEASLSVAGDMAKVLLEALTP